VPVVLMAAARILRVVRRPRAAAMTLAQQREQLATGLLPDWVTARLDAWLSAAPRGAGPGDWVEDLDDDALCDDDGD